MDPIGRPETSAMNYHYSLRNNPENRSSHVVCVCVCVCVYRYKYKGIHSSNSIGLLNFVIYGIFPLWRRKRFFIHKWNKCIKAHRTSRFGCDFYKFHNSKIYFSTLRAPVTESSQTCFATKYMWYKITRTRNIHKVRKGRVQYRNYKRLKIGSSHAHGHSSDWCCCCVVWAEQITA
jgi:hypothetical protein